jgi:hypothetical protein
MRSRVNSLSASPIGFDRLLQGFGVILTLAKYCECTAEIRLRNGPFERARWIAEYEAIASKIRSRKSFDSRAAQKASAAPRT